MSHHAAVWIDHTEARIFQFSGDSVDETVIKAPPHHHFHHRQRDGHRPEDDLHFLQQITHALVEAREIVILGPGNAKLGLIRHLHAHNRPVEAKVVGVETVDHPTDNQVVAFAKKYFKAKDRMI